MNTKNNCIRTEKTDTVLRPYEKCLTLGAETLSDAELLAVILRTGVSVKGLTGAFIHHDS